MNVKKVILFGRAIKIEDKDPKNPKYREIRGLFKRPFWYVF